jgi:hypothetical protein
MHRVEKLKAGIRRALNFKAQVLSRLKGASSAPRNGARPALIQVQRIFQTLEHAPE